MLDSAATHFFCTNRAQFKILNVDAAEKKISMANENIIKSASYRTVRLLVNDKNH